MIPGLSEVLSSDTIVALATPQGRGAIAIVRVSGPRSLEIASGHIQPWPLPPRKLQLCHVKEREKLLDRALVASYEAPDSFTGENMVEIFTHGGRIVPASVLSALVQSGARAALPGEFTRRAVLNGKFDVTQAEAIGDLVDASSRRMQETALAQLDGGLSARISDLRDMLLELEALIAYDIDFPEEDDGPISRERVAAAVSRLLEALGRLLATIPVGEMVREGARVVIAGPPNVGKSSLFNALLGQQRAIVTPVPGTTRDAIEAVVDTGRWPIRLIDTAGLRDSTDVVERLGIETSEQQIRLAHLVLACGEDSEQIEGTAQAINRVAAVPVLSVLTKVDEAASRRQPDSRLTELSSVEVSSRTGTGLAELIAAIELKLSQEYEGEISDVPLLMRTRHVRALGEARDEVASFEAAWKNGSVPVTLAAVHLRAASGALENLVGAIGVEDVLDRVFSSFCVGK